MEPHLICVVTPGLYRCGVVSNTEMSGGLVCLHCCHETAVTANGGERELYRKLVKHLLEVRLQHCSLISNRPFFSCMFGYIFLLFAVTVICDSVPSQEQRAGTPFPLCQAAAHPAAPALAAAHLGKDLQELWPKANVAVPDSAPSSQTCTLSPCKSYR